MVAYSLFTSSISAMRAQSVAFQSIGDNISNSTTTGYKAGAARFQEVMVGHTKGSLNESLLGTEPSKQVFRNREGLVVNTNRNFDSALSGDGFYVTSSSITPSDATIELTDAGQFDRGVVQSGRSEQVYLTDIKGNYVLGWPYSTTSNTFAIDTASTASLSPIRLNQEETFAARPTSTVGLELNLPASASAGDVHSFDFNLFDGSGTADTVSDIQQLTTSFTKNAAANTWDMRVSGTNGTVTQPAAQPIPVVFDSAGQLVSVNGVAGSTLNLSVTWANSSATNAIALNFQNSSQYDGPATRRNLTLDGNLEGTLSSVSLGENGNIIGTYSNQLQRPIARIAVGDVIEPNRLVEAGETHFRLGAQSGPLRLINLEQASGVQFISSALESSTTELNTEFTNMIVSQRAYSSAATSLRTVDEMLRIAAELK